MNEAISEEVKTLYQRYQALALSENAPHPRGGVAGVAAFRYGQTHIPRIGSSIPV